MGKSSKTPRARDGETTSAPARSVEIHWRPADTYRDGLAQAAREVAECLLGLPQRRLDAPEILTSRPKGAREEDWRTTQAAEPLSFVEAGERFSGITWSVDVDSPAAIASALRGERANAGVGAASARSAPDRQRARCRPPDSNGNAPVFLDEAKTTLDSRPETQGRGMTSAEPNMHPSKQRRPMVINRRPGEGGHQRRSDSLSFEEKIDGLEEYGDFSWRTVDGGARIGRAILNPDGNATAHVRQSNEDSSRNERAELQLRPVLALAEHEEELCIRDVVVAINMPGTRDVRTAGYMPRPGRYVRHDLQISLDAHEQGQIDHVIWRDGDRIARAILPGMMAVGEWRERGVRLWLASWNREVDYDSDELALQATMMVSGQERKNIVRRTQMGAINKGPLAGVGWRGRKKFGFVRHPATHELSEDWQQWPWVLRAFEIADSGECLDGAGLSTRDVAKALSEEGCTFDHDRIRVILADPIYCTGEHWSNVRGVKIAQRPIPLAEPVPIDRFHRVQTLLALRQARSENTPLGEYVLNYTECVHAPCEHTRGGKRGGKALIKGYNLNGAPNGRYRHSPFCPQGCHGITWSKNELEDPIILALRELADHPEIRRQISLAAHHERIDSDARIPEDQRRELEAEVERLDAQLDSMTEDFIDGLAAGTAHRADYDRLTHGIVRRIARARKRLENDLANSAATNYEPHGPEEEARRNAFLEILTFETPDDPFLKALRARLIQRILSKVVIREDGDDLMIDLYGRIVPEGTPAEQIGPESNPVLVCADLLDQHIDAGRVEKERSEVPSRKDARLERIGGISAGLETDLSVRADKSVWKLYSQLLDLPSIEEQQRAERARLDATGWRKRHGRRPEGRAAWSLTLIRRPGDWAEDVVERALQADPRDRSDRRAS